MGIMAKKRSSEGRPPSQRQLRVGESIRRTLSEIFLRGDLYDPDIERMSITVGEVRVTSDLRYATAYILPLGGENKKACLDALRRNRAEIRHMVIKGMSLKFAPELRFELDETYDQMDATKRLLSNEAVRRDLDPE